MKFYEALKLCVEEGKKITRSDWNGRLPNGRKMFVFYTEPKEDDVEHGFIDMKTDYGYGKIHGYFSMLNAQSELIVGWLATQTDMVSDKWEIIE